MLRQKLYKKVKHGQAQRDAINYPTEFRIDVDRNEWIVLLPIQKASFVYHEYLAIGGFESDKPTISRHLTNILSLVKINKIVTNAVPHFDFQCSLTKYNPKKMSKTRQDCGTTSLSTEAFTNKNSEYFHNCRQAVVSVSYGITGGYIDHNGQLKPGFTVQLSHLETGSEETWGQRSPNEYATFMVDPYSVPNLFRLTLTTQEGLPLLKSSVTYAMGCKRQ